MERTDKADEPIAGGKEREFVRIQYHTKGSYFLCSWDVA